MDRRIDRVIPIYPKKLLFAGVEQCYEEVQSTMGITCIPMASTLLVCSNESLLWLTHRIFHLYTHINDHAEY